MIVTEVKEYDDQILGFEVRRFALGSRGYIVRIVRSIPEVRITRKPKFLSRLRETQFCEFELAGCIFKIWEPLRDRRYTSRGLYIRHIITTKTSAGCSERMDLIRQKFLGS